jgi:hypothetical protein
LISVKSPGIISVTRGFFISALRNTGFTIPDLFSRLLGAMVPRYE